MRTHLPAGGVEFQAANFEHARGRGLVAELQLDTRDRSRTKNGFTT